MGCTSCGASIEPGGTVCASCGTPASNFAAPPIDSATQTDAHVQAFPPPPPPPPPAATPNQTEAAGLYSQQGYPTVQQAAQPQHGQPQAPYGQPQYGQQTQAQHGQPQYAQPGYGQHPGAPQGFSQPQYAPHGYPTPPMAMANSTSRSGARPSALAWTSGLLVLTGIVRSLDYSFDLVRYGAGPRQDLENFLAPAWSSTRILDYLRYSDLWGKFVVLGAGIALLAALVCFVMSISGAPRAAGTAGLVLGASIVLSAGSTLVDAVRRSNDGYSDTGTLIRYAIAPAGFTLLIAVTVLALSFGAINRRRA